MKHVFACALLIAVLHPVAQAQQRPRSAAAPAVPQTTANSDRARIDVESYSLDVTLVPGERRMEAVAEIRLRQLDRNPIVTLDLDRRFKVDEVSMNGDAPRWRQFGIDDTLEIDLSRAPLSDVQTFKVEYHLSPEDSQEEPGANRVSEEMAIFLYDGKWFPLNGLFADKAETKLHVKAPSGWTLSSDLTPTTEGMASTFASKEPGFWGLIAAGKYASSSVKADGREVHIETLKADSAGAQSVAQTAAKILSFYEQRFGPAPGGKFRIIEVPGDNWKTSWSAGTLLLPTSQFRADFDVPSLARTLAHQWFPLKFAVRDPERDAWLEDGMSVFASLLYFEKVHSPAELQEQVDKALVKALSADGKISVRQAGSLEKSSADYHALVEYKGAFILHMLKWVMGGEKFDRLLTQYVEKFSKTPASTEALNQLASDVAGEDMTYFFDQWLNSSGVPELKEDWVIKRTGSGWEITGQIKQDLDLFRMPVEIQFITDGDPEYRRVEVQGSASNFEVTTERKPKEVLIDPRKRILRMSDDIRVAVFINRGEEASNENRHNDAIDDYQKAIDIEEKNSLALFRMAESWFELRNLQTASDVFKQALQGNLKPKWVEVWAYINIGKIWDIRGNRERAVQEYQKALNTGDDSYGAQAEAQRYLDRPFRRSGTTIGE